MFTEPIMESYQLNKHYKTQVIHINEINDNVIIIDDFLSSLAPVYHFASEVAYFQPPGSDGTLYPGKRDEMPAPYYRVFEQLMAELIDKGILVSGENSLYLHKCKLSIVAQKPNELSPLQRMPHIDSTDDKTFAAVHYLSGKEWGGTGIYKYLPANVIKVGSDNKEIIFEMINDMQQYESTHQGYLNTSTELFEKVVNIEAKENRVVIYKSNLLHSAAIIKAPTNEPTIGNCRLSISSFFRID